ncbi:MAG TPA: 50S ribosomal protein L31 [Actinomycetota bacterium]|nr:50S ribosomal protein L31 [Actinomycetota bacterium]
MKKEVHPAYGFCKVHCACGAEFVTRTVKGEIKVEICSECHPFYTGKQKFIDVGGRVDRFNKRQQKTEALNKPAKKR